MKHYQLLGHSNAALSIILDTLYCFYGPDVTVEIISNIQVKHHKTNNIPYAVKEIKTREIFYDQWQYNNNAYLLLAALQVETKIAIYKFFSKLQQIRPEQYSSLCHPSAVVANNVQSKNGLLINPNVTIAPYAELDHFVTVGRNVSIGHHSHIGAFTSINPGCSIAGHCKIGNGVSVGIGANILDHLEIGDNCIIGAGSLVTKSIPENVIAYGVPAKIIRKREISGEFIL